MAQPNPKAREIGKRIALARREAGAMTQDELAALIKVAPRTMQAYEQGEIIPYKYLRDLERVLNRPAAWFLHGDDALRARDDQFAEIISRLERIERLLAGPASR